MKTTFIVTSALVTDIGVFDLTTRLQQTHQTLDSIYAKFPDANVLLVDGGKTELKTTQHPLLESLKDRVGAFLDLTDDDQITHLHSIPTNHKRELGGIAGLVKSMAEMTIFQQALLTLRDYEQIAALKDVDRIFKVTGRYQLSPLFNPEVYRVTKGKYAFKERTPSWIPNPLETVGTDHCFQSRCWSFDVSLLDEVIDKYDRMMEDLQALSDENRYIDIEHLLYKHIGPDNAIEFDYVHFMGTIGPNGTMIYD